MEGVEVVRSRDGQGRRLEQGVCGSSAALRWDRGGSADSRGDEGLAAAEGNRAGADAAPSNWGLVDIGGASGPNTVCSRVWGLTTVDLGVAVNTGDVQSWLSQGHLPARDSRAKPSHQSF